jgi:Ca-activated chloride channel family protein
MRNAKLIISISAAAFLAGCASTWDDFAGAPGTERGAATVSAAPPPPLVMAAPSPSNEVIVTAQKRTGNVSASVANVTSIDAARVRPGYVPPVYVATDPGRERYDGEEVSPVKLTSAEPVSTFSVDVDTGAYANTRRFLSMGNMPPRDAVRTEELINYFRYDYASPEDRRQPFTVTTDAAASPWNRDTKLLRIGLRGYDLSRSERPAANLVFLLDVSGSMNSHDKLPLVKNALSGLAGELSPKDKVSIVVYAGAAGLVLEPASDTKAIRRALDNLSAGGSTAGGAGIQLAYQIAEDNRIEGGVNRVILATDGDFNVGVSNQKALIEMIEDKRDSGITLTTLGFGTGNYNEAMMEQIANHGNGNYSYIDSALEAKKVLGDEMQSTLFTIAKDVKIQVEFNPAVVSQYRLIGYENRILREEDFNNDAVDAGDIGAGHQVTAIYEIVPAGAKGWITPRRYDDAPSVAATAQAGEAAHVKLRYKLPDGETSRLIYLVVPASALKTAAQPRSDFAFAAAVAAYGQKLRNDPMLAEFSYAEIEKLAGPQSNFWRQEFKQLVTLAGSMKGG